ncbi:MAG: hypothetical protein ACRDCE_23095 [Cetobacterium sp.]|uniref:hypothetical protein n=1 Tax=Cetobacterium sp. TaxID=2071632 RepID=UPI003EE5510C
MSSNAYLTRLEQLKSEKAQTVARTAVLPLQAPGQEPPQDKKMLGVPPKEEEQAPATMFERNLENFRGQDTRFGQMMDEYTKLALGLKEQVQSGYMPKVIAEKKLQEYLSDSGKYFDTNAMKPTDNPEVRGMLEGLMQQTMGGGQPQEGMPPQGAQMPPQGQPAPQMGGM